MSIIETKILLIVLNGIEIGSDNLPQLFQNSFNRTKWN